MAAVRVVVVASARMRATAQARDSQPQSLPAAALPTAHTSTRCPPLSRQHTASSHTVTLGDTRYEARKLTVDAGAADGQQRRPMTALCTAAQPAALHAIRARYIIPACHDANSCVSKATGRRHRLTVSTAARHDGGAAHALTTCVQRVSSITRTVSLRFICVTHCCSPTDPVHHSTVPPIILPHPPTQLLSSCSAAVFASRRWWCCWRCAPPPSAMLRCVRSSPPSLSPSLVAVCRRAALRCLHCPRCGVCDD